MNRTVLYILAGVAIFISMNFNKLKVLAIDLIKQFEGLRLNAYQDAGGVWTIGYGTTIYPDGSPVEPGDTITQFEAEQFFKHDLNNFAQSIEDLITVDLNNNQFSALLSLAYNIGIGAFSNSTILRLVNENPNNPEIANQFLRWIYVNGQVIQGLINRREQEKNLYFT